PDDLIYLYTYKSGLYLGKDSLRLASQLIDQITSQSQNTTNKDSKAMALRAKTYLNDYLNLTEQVIKDSKDALKLLESEKDQNRMKYHLNYILYATYSGWNDSEKMEHYIKECEKYARTENNQNHIANVYLGYASVFLNRNRKDKV